SHAFPGVGFCLGEGQEIDWIGHTEYSETRIEQLDHIFNLIGMNIGDFSALFRPEKGAGGPCRARLATCCQKP
ncbi:hypothetical protein VCX83_19045, partial [Aeromonas caviae]|uniref:hypothetical protein n=1 Tax=Aeromonas caviae TaxID=648 RepID=UPI002B250606